jgi:hypothetical protein
MTLRGIASPFVTVSTLLPCKPQRSVNRPYATLDSSWERPFRGCRHSPLNGRDRRKGERPVSRAMAVKYDGDWPQVEGVL